MVPGQGRPSTHCVKYSAFIALFDIARLHHSTELLVMAEQHKESGVLDQSYTYSIHFAPRDCPDAQHPCHVECMHLILIRSLSSN